MLKLTKRVGKVEEKRGELQDVSSFLLAMLNQTPQQSTKQVPRNSSSTGYITYVRNAMYISVHIV